MQRGITYTSCFKIHRSRLLRKDACKIEFSSSSLRHALNRIHRRGGGGAKRLEERVVETRSGSSRSVTRSGQYILPRLVKFAIGNRLCSRVAVNRRNNENRDKKSKIRRFESRVNPRDKIPEPVRNS